MNFASTIAEARAQIRQGQVELGIIAAVMLAGIAWTISRLVHRS